MHLLLSLLLLAALTEPSLAAKHKHKHKHRSPLIALDNITNCNEPDSTPLGVCFSRGLRQSPACRQVDGRVALWLRSEWGFEFTHALPAAYALHLAGRLGTTCGCGRDTEQLYWFNKARHWGVMKCKRRWDVTEAAALGWTAPPKTSTGGFHNGASTWPWAPPPLREQWRDRPLAFPQGWDAEAPLVVVYNKFNANEWNSGLPPINTIPLEALQRVFGAVLAPAAGRRSLAVVYSRSRQHHDAQDRAAQEAEPGDHAWVSSLATQGVRSCLLEDLQAVNHGLSYNDLQFRLLSRARAVISTQGGTAIQAGYFVRDVLVLHRRGHELEAPGNEYERLFARFLAARYTVAFDAQQLFASVQVSLPRWAAPALPASLAAGAAQGAQTQCKSFRTLLPTTSRLGDRLLDTFIVQAVVRLAQPDAACAILQSRASYDLKDVKWGGQCSVSYASDPKAEAARQRPSGECAVDLRPLPAMPMFSGAAEKARNCGACGGTAPPRRVLQLPSVAAMLPPAQRSVSELEISFLRVAAELRLAPGKRAEAVAALLRKHPGKLTGLHLRRSDKVKSHRLSAWDALHVMSREEADKYTARAMAYIRSLPQPAAVYLATDDHGRFAEYAHAVAAAGGVVVNQPPTVDDPWLDLFALAECERVVMASKYSTFATVASLLRRRPLVTFTPTNATLLQLWAPLLVLPMSTPGLHSVKAGTHMEARWDVGGAEVYEWAPPR